MAGASLLPAARSLCADGLAVSQDASTVTIAASGQALLRYRHADVPFKPYVAELYTLGGVQILRDSPFDHKHHHALMFAVAAEGVNFWEETPVSGKQLGQPCATSSTSTSFNGASAARSRIDQNLTWVGPDSSALLVEKRSVELLQGSDVPATLVTWRSRLEVPAGKQKVTLSGAHYFGLGMRFLTSMDEGGRFFNPENLEGEVVRGSERLTPVRWMAYAAQANGKPVTVALFDSPSNPRHPATMFTMAPFAYLSATLNLTKEPLDIPAAKPLDLAYGVAVWDGHAAPEQVESLYRLWVERSRE